MACRGKEAEGEPDDHTLGYSRGGFGTKVHLVVDGRGTPPAATVTPGLARESKSVELTLRAVRLPSRKLVRPRTRIRRLAGTRSSTIPGSAATYGAGASGR